MKPDSGLQKQISASLLRDASGHYTGSLILFGTLASLAAVAAFAARRPGKMP